MYTYKISGTEKEEEEALFDSIFLMPLKHAYASKELHWSNIRSCIIKHSAVKYVHSRGQNLLQMQISCCIRIFWYYFD